MRFNDVIIYIEFERNGERYSFLKWGQQAFDNFRIVKVLSGVFRPQEWGQIQYCSVVAKYFSKVYTPLTQMIESSFKIVVKVSV